MSKKSNKYYYIFQIVNVYAKIYKDSQIFPIHKNLVKILLYWNFLENVGFERIREPTVKKII